MNKSMRLVRPLPTRVENFVLNNRRKRCVGSVGPKNGKFELGHLKQRVHNDGKLFDVHNLSRALK